MDDEHTLFMQAPTRLVHAPSMTCTPTSPNLTIFLFVAVVRPPVVSVLTWLGMENQTLQSRTMQSTTCRT